MTQVSQAPASTRAQIKEATLRKDPWWRQPAITAAALTVVVVYLTWASLVNADYFWKPYISPLYSPCLATTCAKGAGFDWIPWLTWLTPAIIIIGGPMGFRLTCYYYRKAYYRAFWRAPAACAVREPHAKDTGETRFPLILQNVHRYFFWIAMVFNVILTIDAVIAFRDHARPVGAHGPGHARPARQRRAAVAVLAVLPRVPHVTGGRLKHFSKHPVRYWMWTQVSKLNARHMQFAWVSLFWVLFTDLYIRLVASGVISDPQFF